MYNAIPSYLQNKNDGYKALLAMAVGIEQMHNVDTMARKVRVHPSFSSEYILLCSVLTFALLSV